MRYIKKPVEIEAIQWTGDNLDEIKKFVGSFLLVDEVMSRIYIRTLEGRMEASKNDYIIKGVDGEFYPCKPTIFEKTYDKAVDLGVKED